MEHRLDKRALGHLYVLLSVLLLSSCTGSHTAKEARSTPPPGSTNSVTRRVYPYSLIPGGVESAAELQSYSRVDAMLAAHYRGLGDGLSLEKVKQDQWLYASYKIDNAVYWTKNRILVHSGEGVLTNGTDMVRARCGNRLSTKAQIPVRHFEPPSVYTDRFIPQIVVLQPPGLLEPYTPSALPDFPAVSPPEVTRTPPAVETGGGGRSGIAPAIVTGGSRVAQVYTPEPATWLLMLIGLAGFISAAFHRKRRQL